MAVSSLDPLSKDVTSTDAILADVFGQPDFASRLFEENGDALFLIEPESDCILLVNKTGLRLTGFPRHELNGCQASDLFRFDEAKTNSDPLREATEKTTLFHGQGGFLLRVRQSPGWLPVTITVTRLHAKPTTYALYTVRDDTDRRDALGRAQLAETEVRKSEARFRAMVEKSGDGILVADARGKVQYASPTLTRILGHLPAVLEGRSLFDSIHADDRAEARKKLLQSISRPGQDVVWRVRMAHASGSWRNIEMTAVSRLDNPDVNGVVFNYRDVTDRTRTEREFREQHALLRALFDSIPDVILYKNRELLFTGGNAAFEDFAAMPMSAMIGKSCVELFPYEWAAQCRVAETSALKTGKPGRLEVWVHHPSGRDVLVDWQFSPIREDSGEIIGLVAIGRDGSSRKRLEDQLRQSQKMEAVGQLAGGVAHDFNNLLTVVLGNIELAREELRGQPQDELLKSTERAARRAAELTSQLLGFARRTPLQLQPTDLGSVLRETVQLLCRTIDPRIVMEVHTRPELWAVLADPGQINQIVMNLCLNARDAMPQGGRLELSTGHVTFTPATVVANPSARPGDYVRLTVRDFGSGMSDEVQSRIFEPFYTTKEIGQGTGLGLAVVFGIIEAHGGWVQCESELGFGTRFDAYIPRHYGKAVLHGTPAAIQSPFGNGERILIADDEPMIRKLASTILTQLKYEVVLAEDGAIAVAEFEKNGGRFDLVILDLSMPNLSGKDAYSRIRKLNAKVPVILASGYSADRDSLQTEGITFLDKPYTPGSLARTVRTVLDR